MLPTGSQGDPDNDYPERLVIPNVFYVKDGGVAFRTRADGFHSANSQYPRTELREMVDDDWSKAVWTNKTGTHSLELTEAITALPTVKPHVVSAQIHSGSDDVLQIRLEGKRLMVMYKDGQATETLDDSYVLGTKFDVKIVAADSRIKVFYNGSQKADLAVSGSGWFWKAGCYLQSNVSKGDKPDAFGEVVIYRMKVSHA
jgi:hypothetical protein